ncbi:MAG TPA: 4Fe-4S dicluster domain-containing protein [Bryobacteraceae bacterium]|nr:4Fe-4S dicluster domain-containing protein [Bryobacteraceae bacterium]
MAGNAPDVGRQYVLDVSCLSLFIPSLERRGYRVIGPMVRGGAIVYDAIGSIEELPAGWTAEQEAGHYRLRRREDGALFGFAPGADGWKRYLYPPEATLFTATQGEHGVEFEGRAEEPPRYALLGVRCCELAAIAIQDRVLLSEPSPDPVYRQRRRNVFLIAVNCTASAPTCFCASMHSGPPAEAGFDLALTEMAGGERHWFLAEAGTRHGAEVLAELSPEVADSTRQSEAEQAVRAVRDGLQRHMQTAGLREILYEHFEHPHWDEIAARCMCCGNCTMVCPTCFCTTVEDTSSLDGRRAERLRRWDSCFTESFSYIHGGSVRMSARSRYRQWLTHKLAAWIDQFGSSGCVGCGRCITWCPAKIDLTQEVALLREPAAARTMETPLAPFGPPAPR